MLYAETKAKIFSSKHTQKKIQSPECPYYRKSIFWESSLSHMLVTCVLPWSTWKCEGQGGLACCSPWVRRVGHDWAAQQQRSTCLDLSGPGPQNCALAPFRAYADSGAAGLGPGLRGLDISPRFSEDAKALGPWVYFNKQGHSYLVLWAPFPFPAVGRLGLRNHEDPVQPS